MLLRISRANRYKDNSHWLNKGPIRLRTDIPAPTQFPKDP